MKKAGNKERGMVTAGDLKDRLTPGVGGEQKAGQTNKGIPEHEVETNKIETKLDKEQKNLKLWKADHEQKHTTI